MGKKLSKQDQQAAQSNTTSNQQKQSTSARPPSRPAQPAASASTSGASASAGAARAPPVTIAATATINEDDVPLGQKYTHYGDKPINVDDFELLKVLGKGSYGKVMLCKKKGEKPPVLYAMKTLRKAALIKRGQVHIDL